MGASRTRRLTYTHSSTAHASPPHHCRYLWAALLAVYLLAAVRGSRAVVLAEFVEVQQGAAPSSLSLPRLTTPPLSPLQVQTQANLSTTALLQQRLRKVEKERDVARKIEGRIRQEIRRRETQESVADDAGWKSGGEG